MSYKPAADGYAGAFAVDESFRFTADDRAAILAPYADELRELAMRDAGRCPLLDAASSADARERVLAAELLGDLEGHVAWYRSREAAPASPTPGQRRTALRQVRRLAERGDLDTLRAKLSVLDVDSLDALRWKLARRPEGGLTEIRRAVSRGDASPADLAALRDACDAAADDLPSSGRPVARGPRMLAAMAFDSLRRVGIDPGKAWINPKKPTAAGDTVSPAVRFLGAVLATAGARLSDDRALEYASEILRR